MANVRLRAQTRTRCNHQNINLVPSLDSTEPESKMKATNDPHWVLIHLITAHTGYSDDAIRAKQRRGDWREGVHWRKAPDNRNIYNLTAIKAWMEGTDA